MVDDALSSVGRRRSLISGSRALLRERWRRVHVALETLELQRYLDGSSQVRQPFAPVPRGYGEHLAAHVLVIGSAPLTVLSARVSAGGVI